MIDSVNVFNCSLTLLPTCKKRVIDYAVSRRLRQSSRCHAASSGPTIACLLCDLRDLRVNLASAFSQCSVPSQERLDLADNTVCLCWVLEEIVIGVVKLNHAAVGDG